MRKTNIDLDRATKIVQPRLLHTSNWGFMCPLDTPDGENIGLHKYIAVGALVSPHIEVKPIYDWLVEQCGDGLVPLHGATLSISSPT